jgi:signal transduction histidine kinase
MKKRILIGLAIFTSIFLVGGIYIISAIQKSTATLDRLIKLHQVAIMREQLLMDAKRVQADLAFKYTRYAKELDIVVANVIRMGREMDRCSGCHHTQETAEKLKGLRNQIDVYEDALSRLLTIRANVSRLRAEEDAAFRVGQELVTQLNTMVTLASTRLERKTRSALKGINDTKDILFALIALGPIMALGLAVLFIRGFTKPLDALLQATRKIRGGDLSFRVRGLRDEFGEVAESFNDMAASLGEQVHKMARAEQMTVVGEMAAGLVHEIKNPLAGIKAAMQVLLDQGDIPEEDRFILGKVIDEVKRVESLMKDLLNFAKPAKPQLVPVNMNDVLKSTLTFALPYHSSSMANSSKTINVVSNLDPNLPTLMVDPMHMHQVFLNLIMNAVEAMPDGGDLTVTTSTIGPAQKVQIQISDRGKGIDSRVTERLFQPFFTTKHKGTGLGLAITKQFVEMHGGTISAEANPGGGAAFRILLPYAEVEEASTPTVPPTEATES